MPALQAAADERADANASQDDPVGEYPSTPRPREDPEIAREAGLVEEDHRGVGILHPRHHKAPDGRSATFLIILCGVYYALRRRGLSGVENASFRESSGLGSRVNNGSEFMVL